MEKKKTIALVFKHPTDKPINLNGGQYGAPRYNGRTHKGIDYLAPQGTDVKASESGIVVYSGERPYRQGGSNNLGNTIVIDHTPDVPDDQRHIYTLYAHLNSMSVFMHKRVIQGEPIGEIGRASCRERV